MTSPLPCIAPRQEMELNVIERQLLDALERAGPIRVGQIPVRWPLVRAQLPAALERLAAAGLVRLSPPGGAGSRSTLVVPFQSAGSSRAKAPFGLSVST